MRVDSSGIYAATKEEWMRRTNCAVAGCEVAGAADPRLVLLTASIVMKENQELQQSENFAHRDSY